MRLNPQIARGNHWVNTGIVPPLRLISRPMQCPMMAAAKWHRELVTYSASHGAVLCKSDVMGVSRTTAAEQTRLGRHVLDVIPIPDATWFRYGEKTLVDACDSFFPRERREPAASIAFDCAFDRYVSSAVFTSAHSRAPDFA
jgi:hypothetical protein